MRQAWGQTVGEVPAVPHPTVTRCSKAGLAAFQAEQNSSGEHTRLLRLLTWDLLAQATSLSWPEVATFFFSLNAFYEFSHTHLNPVEKTGAS